MKFTKESSLTIAGNDVEFHILSKVLDDILASYGPSEEEDMGLLRQLSDAVREQR